MNSNIQIVYSSVKVLHTIIFILKLVHKPIWSKKERYYLVTVKDSIVFEYEF